IMIFVWRTGTLNQLHNSTLTFTRSLLPRIIISSTHAVGLIYFGLIIATIRRYGDVIEREGRKRLKSGKKGPSVP
ncbi:hypothetical protein M422DRAFT_185819, partial [Sphaerobolus stellatus SS14]